MSVDAAVTRVAEVLREQWGAAPARGSPGYAFCASLSSFDSHFSDVSPSEEQLARVIKCAETDHDAYLALKYLLALGYGNSSPELNLWGCKLAAGTVKEPPRKKGPAKIDNIWRDHLVVGQIKILIQAGFFAMRNEATKKEESACDIVAMASHQIDDGRGMTYDTVKKIWERRARLAGPRLLAKSFETELKELLEGRGKS